jgi:ribosome-binding ATPase YchF (GTP1/OBG family)
LNPEVTLPPRFVATSNKQHLTEIISKEKGLLRLEGKEYVVEEGDVLLFKFNV